MNTVRSLTIAALTMTVLSGCAGMYTVERADISNRIKDDAKIPNLPDISKIKMAEALEYSQAYKAEIMDNAGDSFDVGQVLNGLVVGSAVGAASALAFDGNQTAAAAAGLGAGTLSVVDRFLLIDESLGIYKGAINAVTCAQNLLVNFSASPADRGLSNFDDGRDKIIVGNLMTTISSEGNKILENAKINDMTVRALSDSTALVSSAVSESDSADRALYKALENAADGGGDSAAGRLYLFVEQVRQIANIAVLQKRAKPEELFAAFKGTVTEYIKTIKDIKDAAKEAKKKVEDAKEMAILAQYQSAALSSKSVYSTEIISQQNKIFHSISAAAIKSAEAIDTLAAPIPTDEQIDACLAMVASGG